MLIAGAIEVSDVMSALADRRRVFHSEADFQHAFAWEVHRRDELMQVRLETRPESGVHLDLEFSRPDLRSSTAIELKYLTALWSGQIDGEMIDLKSQGAQDIRAYDVVKDVVRVERFCLGRVGRNGAVIAMTNDSSYWRAPTHSRETNAKAFRLYEGVQLAGRRAWGPLTGAGTRRNREADLILAGTHAIHWEPYSALPGGARNNELRYFVVEID